MSKRKLLSAFIIVLLTAAGSQVSDAVPSVRAPLSGHAAKRGEKNSIYMNNKRMGEYLKFHKQGFTGDDGYWTKQTSTTKIYIMTDESHDRMRVMAPIQKLDHSDQELAFNCLEANFDRALDARYALNDGVLWAAFLHPLKSLSETQLDDAIQQVETLVENTGTSFASSDLFFNGGKKEAGSGNGQNGSNGNRKDDLEKI